MQLIYVGWQPSATHKRMQKQAIEKKRDKKEHPSATESQLPDQVGTSKYKVQAMHTLCQKGEATNQAEN